MDVLKFILNFKKNIKCIFDECLKINFKFLKKFKIFNVYMMDVLILILNFNNKSINIVYMMEMLIIMFQFQ